MRPSGLQITEISSVDSDREDLLPRSPSRRNRSTWRTILTTNLTITIIILLAYTGFLIWIYNNRPITNGVTSIYSGSCSKTSRVATYAQLVANAFAVILFATGMYGARILLSPTREETDDAHLHDSWIHVGVAGLRNMRWIHKRRMLTSLALGTATILSPFL